MSKSTISIVILVILGFLGINSLFTMNEKQQGLVLQFGEPKRVIRDSGLNVKLPIIQNTVKYDKRILEYDLPIEEVIAVDKKRMLVDSFTRFKITDPLEFYKTVGTESNVRNRLNSNVISSLRRVVGRVTLDELLSEDRSKIMEDIKQEVNNEASRFGIEIVDVRIRRVDLPAENEESIYARMEAERKRQANKFRSEGEEEAQKIRAATDRDKTIILADAYKEAEKIRGEGDAKAVQVYAKSYSADPKFYEFVRTLDAYKKVVDDKTTLVLPSDSKLFKLLMDGN